MAKVFNPFEEEFEAIDILGKGVIFSNFRLDRSKIPKGLYAYDLRDEINDSTYELELKTNVLVNHFGTIISKYPFEGADEGIAITDKDWGFIDVGFLDDATLTLQYYIDCDPEKWYEPKAIEVSDTAKQNDND